MVKSKMDSTDSRGEVQGLSWCKLRAALLQTMKVTKLDRCLNQQESGLPSPKIHCSESGHYFNLFHTWRSNVCCLFQRLLHLLSLLQLCDALRPHLYHCPLCGEQHDSHSTSCSQIPTACSSPAFCTFPSVL